MYIKFSSICHQCIKETVHTKEDYERYIRDTGEYFEVEFNDDNFYPYICSKGHITNMVIGNQKFELLFDFGAMALIDGYTKECVSTLASSFERLIEFYIWVISIKKDVSTENFIKTWKLVSKQSERQMGAFYLLQLSEYGETKFFIENKWIEFRNKVIHQGYIPSSNEAIEYGEIILAMSFSILNFLKNNALESLKKVEMLELTKSRKRNSKHQMMYSSSLHTIIDLYGIIYRDDFKAPTFKAALDNLSTNPLYKHFYVKKI